MDDESERSKRLRAFRGSHAPKSVTADGHVWSYIECGRGDRVLVLLEGGGAIAEAEFERILHYESAFRVISVTYASTAVRMRDLVRGLAAILNAEGVHAAALHGHSLGGAVAQCFVRAFPDRASHVVLANIGVASARRIRVGFIVGRIIEILPIGLLRATIIKALTRNLRALPDAERAFYGAYLSEVVNTSITKVFFVNQYRCMLDFMMHYHLRTHDVADWGGRVLIVEALDDRGWTGGEQAALRELYPQAVVHTFSHGGHMVGLVGRATYDAVVAEFLGISGARV